MKNTLVIEENVIFLSPTMRAEYLGETGTMIVTASQGFIAEDEFRNNFDSLIPFIESNKVTKLIFDKRQLSVFHLPSMIWYHTEWKPKVAALGLKKHIKLLPNNKVFRMNVEIGRKRIFKSYNLTNLFGIESEYCETMEDALKK